MEKRLLLTIVLMSALNLSVECGTIIGYDPKDFGTKEGWVPLKISIYPSCCLFNKTTVKGMDLGFFDTVSREVYGLQTSLFKGKSIKGYGLQCCLFGGVVKELYGVQCNMLMSVSMKGYGIQCSPVFNWTEWNLHGGQIGLLNFAAGGFKGVQIGAINGRGENGIQIGLSNSECSKGIQIGIINYCENELKGVQIGVLNIMKDKKTLPYTIGINVGL